MYEHGGCTRAVAAVVRGEADATIMCYGMTSSGKTHTMLGSSVGLAGEGEYGMRASDGDGDDDGADDESEGIVGLAMRQLLAGGQHITASFVQLTGNSVSDLLRTTQPSSRRGDDRGGVPARLRLRDGGEAVTGAETGASQHVVGSAAALAALVRRGSALRTTAAHALSTTSSRSHAVLTLTARSPCGRGGRAPSRLHCVDLAGTERVKESGVSGARLKEARDINLSLFTLQRVVLALNSRTTKKGTTQPRIPYNESALTRLLRGSFGSGVWLSG